MASLHPNATADLLSAPVPASAVPTNQVDEGITGTDLSYDNKEKDLHPDVAITAGALNYGHDGEEEPTDEEFHTLRKLPASLPWVAVAMCFVEMAERASYYGITQVVTNFVNHKLPVGGNGAGAVAPGAAGANEVAGALGKGSVTSSAVTNAFKFLAYLFPIMGGIVADAAWGRFKTIAVGVIFGIIAHFLLVVSSLPKVIREGKAIGPFLFSYYLLSFATGFIKPCLATLMCDQSPVKKPIIKTLPTGERVIVDPSTTVARYLLIFYWCINVGSFYAVASSYIARDIGFWLAYLIPGLIYCLCPIVLFVCYKRLYLAPPQGSVTLEAIKVVSTVLKNGGWKRMWKGGDQFWNHAKPSYIEARDGTIDRKKVFWDDMFVDEIRQSLSATAVFFIIPVFLLADGGVGSEQNDMSAAMTLNGVPNDVISNFNPLTIIVATPIITYGLYPWMEKKGWPLKPMTRMCIGFMLACANMIYGAVLQWRIYKLSPCGYYASTCDTVTSVSLWAQIPLNSLPAIGEIFVMVTSYELAYTRAPARMKGLVYGICLFNSAISAAIGLACSNAIQDPYLIWVYVAMAVATFLCGLLFPTYFKHLNEPTRVFADPARQAGLQQPNAKPLPVTEEKANV